MSTTPTPTVASKKLSKIERLELKAQRADEIAKKTKIAVNRCKKAMNRKLSKQQARENARLGALLLHAAPTDPAIAALLKGLGFEKHIPAASVDKATP